MGKYGRKTGFLFAPPDFLYGFASVIDLGGTLIEYNISATPQEADFRATASDWAIIGEDILLAVEKFEQ